jgi:cell division protein FtsQ
VRSTSGRQTGRAELVALPARRRPAEVGPAQWLPSTRSILLGLLLVLGAFGAYFAARNTSLFAVRMIEVQGAPPAVAAEVRAALAPALGTSLVAFDRAAAERRLTTLPEVASAQLDRAFPHILRVVVQLETPVAVLRRGPLAWLASARGRVLEQLTARPYPPLPRIWLSGSAAVAVNSRLGGARAAAGPPPAPLRHLRFPKAVRSIIASGGSVTLILASGGQVRLGAPAQLPLKLAVAQRILVLAGETAYVDVSVPDRPVAAQNPQVGG